MCAVPTTHSKRSDVDRNWRIFLWFRVLFSARFYYPVMAVLFLDLGLTAIQYTLLNVAWAAASLLSDIPAGVLADRIGRKPLLVAAGCLMIAEMVILCLAPHNGGGVLFLFCLANRVLSGLAEGAASGADEAIVFDDGVMHIPSRPGLGIELNEAAIAAHPYEPKDLRHFRGDLTDIRPPTAVEWYRRQT